MKSFWPVLLTFILYSGVCVFLLNFYFLDKYPTQKISKVSNNMNLHIDTIAKPEKKKNLFLQKPSIVTSSLVKKDTAINDSKKKTDSIIFHESRNENLTPDTHDTLLIYKPKSFAVYGNTNEIIVDCNAFATIFKNKKLVKIPYTCINYGMEIKKIFDTDESALLTITGYSDSQENNSLGKDRADYLKNLLLGIGVNSDRIKTNSSFQNISFINGAAKGGIHMQMQSSKNQNRTNASTRALPLNTNNYITPTSGPYAYKKITEGFKGDYFYGNQSFNLYISKIKDFLKQNPNKKINIYSHTTSVGNSDDNMSIAKANIITAKKLILQSGILESKFKSHAMGEKPVDANGSITCLIITVN